MTKVLTSLINGNFRTDPITEQNSFQEGCDGVGSDVVKNEELGQRQLDPLKIEPWGKQSNAPKEKFTAGVQQPALAAFACSVHH